MRVLLSTTAGSGHFGPLIPIGRACAAAGHTAAVAAPASLPARRPAPASTTSQFRMYPARPRPPSSAGDPIAPRRGQPRGRRRGVRLLMPRMAAGVDATMDTWAPDIVLRETCEFASTVAADGPGSRRRTWRSVWASWARWSRWWRSCGRTVRTGRPSRGRGVELRWLRIPLPRHELLDRTDAASRHRRRIRAPGSPGWGGSEKTRTGAPAGDASWGKRENPLLYVTSGSVTASVGHFVKICPATLRALADLPVRAPMTTGDGLDPPA